MPVSEPFGRGICLLRQCQLVYESRPFFFSTKVPLMIESSSHRAVTLLESIGGGKLCLSVHADRQQSRRPNRSGLNSTTGNVGAIDAGQMDRLSRASSPVPIAAFPHGFFVVSVKTPQLSGPLFSPGAMADCWSGLKAGCKLMTLGFEAFNGTLRPSNTKGLGMSMPMSSRR